MRQIADVRDVDDFHLHSLKGVESLLPHTVVSSELHDLSALKLVSSAQTRNDDHFMSLMPAFAEFLNEHPCVDAAMKTRDLRIMGVHDRLAERDFQSLTLYNEFYRHVDIKDQIIIARSQGFPSLIALAVSRDERFTPEERQMLELFAPALAEAHQNWLALRHAAGKHAWALGALDRVQCGAICVDRAGNIRDQNPLASQLMNKYLKASTFDQRLPQRVAAWFKQSIIAKGQKVAPLVQRGDEGQLEFRLIPSETDEQLILCREQKDTVDLQPLLDLGLTPAMAEVLHGCCLGLTYPQIAAKLGKSPRTVSTQMLKIFKRLDVHDKAQAVAHATNALNGRPPI